MDIATIFFHDGYKLARQIVAQETGPGTSTHTSAKYPGRNAILRLMAAAYESIDGLIDSFCKRCEREGLAVECRKACTWCCSQAVLASNHEILAINSFLGKKIDAEILDGIKSRTAEKHSATADMSVMEFLHYTQPCPFLREGSCLVYPVRPMACRCYLSASMESCREQHDHPRDHRRIAALYEFPLQAGRAMNEGIRSALMEWGLIPSEWLLEAFMAAIFVDENILDEWLEGKTPFNIRKLDPGETSYLREYYGRPAISGE